MRRKIRLNRRTALLTLLVLAALLAARVYRQQPEDSEWRLVTRVVDGDTLVLDGGERVRLIGVDTPELHAERPAVRRLAQAAKEFSESMAEGRRVRLEYGSQRRDRYGRTLAYVYVEDGRMLNREIVRQGYGYAYTRFPFRYQEEFRRLQREAREGNRGLWGER